MPGQFYVVATISSPTTPSSRPSSAICAPGGHEAGMHPIMSGPRPLSRMMRSEQPSRTCLSTLGAGQRGQLGHGEALASDGTDPCHPLPRAVPRDEIEEIPAGAEMGTEVSSTGAAAWPTPGRRLALRFTLNKRPQSGTCTNLLLGVQAGNRGQVKMTWARRPPPGFSIIAAEGGSDSWAPASRPDAPGAAGRVQPPGRVHDRVLKTSTATCHHEPQGSARRRAPPSAWTKMGVHSLKIGAVPSPFTTAPVPTGHRKAIDDAVKAGNVRSIRP